MSPLSPLEHVAMLLATAGALQLRPAEHAHSCRVTV
jgi:hypothetical protein